MSTEYYQKNKERLRKKARERYQNISNKEKSKRWKYGHERNRNLSEEENNKKYQYGRERYKKLFYFIDESLKDKKF